MKVNSKSTFKTVSRLSIDGYLWMGMRAKMIKTVVYVRNPKDATVSLFNHLKNGIQLNYEGKDFNDFAPLYFTKHGKIFSQASFDKPHKIMDYNGYFLKIISVRPFWSDNCATLNVNFLIAFIHSSMLIVLSYLKKECFK